MPTQQQIVEEAKRLYRVVHPDAIAVDFWSSPNMVDYHKLAEHVLSRLEPTILPTQDRREMSLKCWLMRQARRYGITYSGAFRRYQRGTMIPRSIHRVNKRVIWVEA